MLQLVEKLKSLMNNYTDSVKRIVNKQLTQGDVYNKDFISKQVAEEKERIRISVLNNAKTLSQDLMNEFNSSKRKLFQVKYPNSSNDVTRVAGEMQISHAREILKDKDSDFEKILQEISFAIERERTDFVSYLIDQIEEKQLFPEDSRLVDLKNSFYTKINAKQLVDDVDQLDFNSQLCDLFINDLNSLCEYAPYPLSEKERSEITDEQYFANQELMKKTMEYVSKITTMREKVSL